MSRARALVAAVITTASLTVPLLVTAPAYADDDGIGLSAGTDLVAVQASPGHPGHLVAADASDTTAGVVVTNADGTSPVAVAVPSPTALALDGRTVWVSSSTGALYSFKVDDPSEPARHTAENMSCVSDLAVIGSGLVYVIEGGCTATPDYSLHTFDPSDDTLSDAIDPGVVPLSSTTPMWIDNSPASPDRLAIAGKGEWFDTFDVAGGTSELGTQDGINVTSILMAPDGQTVLVGSSDAIRRYELHPDPQVIGSPMYGVGYAIDGIAADSTGQYVAGASYSAFLSYGPSRSDAIRTYRPSPAISDGRTLAWMGQTLFSLVTDDGEVFLQSHTDAVTAPTSLSLVPPVYTPTVGNQMRISGVVSDRGTPLGGVSVTLTRTDHDGTVTFNPKLTAANGAYEFITTPRDGLTNVFRVSYAGTTLHAPVSASLTRSVARKATFLSVYTDKTDYLYGGLAKVTAHLGTTYVGRNVAIYAQPAGLSKVRIGYGHVDSSGYLHASYHVHRNTVFSATFGGDWRYAPVTKTLLRKTRANVVAELKGWYGTESGYRLYHKSVNAQVHAHVDPYKSGQCVYFPLEQLVNGAWKLLTWTDCYHLNSSSNVDIDWLLSHFAAIGGKYRTGAYWEGDRVSEEMGSVWRYFKVTS